jgi:Zn finger protein HypA/HybF involved in hydrogenase expression
VHEMSLALEVCRIAEEQVGIHLLPRVLEVGVRVGDDSGVEPDNLEFCLEALLSRPPFGRARPALEHCPGDELRLSYLEVEDDDPED